MATKYEYFTGTDDSQYGPQSVGWYAQTFTIGSVGTDVSQIAYSVKLKLAKVGTPTGNLTAAIRATSSDLPTGSNLCSATKDVTTLTTTPTWYELVFTTGALMQASTKYAIVVSCPTADGNNAPLWRGVTAGGYAGGERVSSSDSGVTWGAIAGDFLFEIWSELEGSGGGGAIYPTNDLLRASGIRRTFWAGLGGLSVYQVELAVGGMTTSYVSPISSREIPSAVTDPLRAYINRPPPITETGIPGVTMPFTTTTPTAPQMAEYAGMGQAEYNRIIQQGRIAEALREFGSITGPGDLAKFKARYPGLLRG